MPFYLGIGWLMAALLVSFVLDVARNSMIISFGIIATDRIGAIVWLFGTIGAILVSIGAYQFIRGTALERMKKSSLAYRAKTSGHAEIRDQLNIMMSVRPKLRTEISECLSQLNGVKGMYARFEQLIESNDADFVSGAIAGLKDIEQTVCSNLKWVINSSIATEEDAKEEFYVESRERIHQVVEANRLVLEKGNDFLLNIADNISQLEASGTTVLLDSWLQVIREQNRKSLIGGKS